MKAISPYKRCPLRKMHKIRAGYMFEIIVLVEESEDDIVIFAYYYDK